MELKTWYHLRATCCLFCALSTSHLEQLISKGKPYAPQLATYNLLSHSHPGCLEQSDEVGKAPFSLHPRDRDTPLRCSLNLSELVWESLQGEVPAQRWRPRTCALCINCQGFGSGGQQGRPRWEEVPCARHRQFQTAPQGTGPASSPCPGGGLEHLDHHYGKTRTA